MSVPRKKLIEALLSAEAHVFRQQKHGKHGQDREDAVAWMEKYETVMFRLRRDEGR